MAEPSDRLIADLEWPAWKDTRAYLQGLFHPPEKLPLSEWAEANIVLSPYAARSSRLRLFGWGSGRSSMEGTTSTGHRT
jgi:hypothetical protein